MPAKTRVEYQDHNEIQLDPTAYEILLEKIRNRIVGIVFRASANLIKLNSGFLNGECDIIVTEASSVKRQASFDFYS